MATKAERFKADEQRNRQKPRASTSKARSDGPLLAQRAPESTGARNASKHASRKAAYDLEDTRASSARPSRKSTRKSGNRQKHATQLKARQTMRTRSPRARAEKAQAANIK